MASTTSTYWTGKSEKSARREFFYYDETDLMALRVDGWKMHIGVKRDGSWFNAKYYPSIPYVFNLLMDPLEKMDPESHEWGAYAGRKFFAQKFWAATAAGPFVQPLWKAWRRFRRPGRRHAQHEEGPRRDDEEAGQAWRIAGIRPSRGRG